MRNSHVVSLQAPFQLQPESYAWYAIHFDEIKGKKVRIEGYLEEFALTRAEADNLILSARDIAFK